jgi:mRNA interferase RelE/StbE
VKQIVLTGAATRQLAKLPASVQGRVLDKLEGYASGQGGDVRRLRDRPGSRLRVGNYRVIFIENAETVTVFAVGHRRQIYE